MVFLVSLSNCGINVIVICLSHPHGCVRVRARTHTEEKYKYRMGKISIVVMGQGMIISNSQPQETQIYFTAIGCFCCKLGTENLYWTAFHMDLER